jgi:hypothetical protein
MASLPASAARVRCAASDISQIHQIIFAVKPPSVVIARLDRAIQ